jgi:hypothetical protein
MTERDFIVRHAVVESREGLAGLLPNSVHPREIGDFDHNSDM